MLKSIIENHGKQKLNTLTKYPSILTLHKIGAKGRLSDVISIDLDEDDLFATEKIDGTNVRIIILEDEYIIGSRENLLYHCDDLFFDPAQGIVESLDLKFIKETDKLTVIFGELFGGKITANSKQYGTEKTGFRVFDIAVMEDLSILNNSVGDISRWREHLSDDGRLVYGQKFWTGEELCSFGGLDLVPYVPSFKITDTSHRGIYESMISAIPETLVPLSDSAKMRPEGLVLRNNDRSKIVKLRFEDYRKALFQNN